MSFGFSISDFLTVIDRARDARKNYVRAPKEFQVISDEYVSALNGSITGRN